MTLSVIIPFYNDNVALLTTLKSINKQKRQPDEIILSDDGSTIPVAEILDFARTMKPAVLYVKQDHKGFRAAKCRNNGLRLATSDFIIFNDQDIAGTEDYYGTFLQYARKREFLVGYPVRLSEIETAQLRSMIESGKSISKKNIPSEKNKKIVSQYNKEQFYYLLKKYLRERGYHPKLRSGVFGTFRENLLRVNGFDESYQNWGFEDDDLGRRLYASGIRGRNVFKDDFPIHQYHPSLAASNPDSNREYYSKRVSEIIKGDFRALYGVSNPKVDEELISFRIKDKTF